MQLPKHTGTNYTMERMKQINAEAINIEFVFSEEGLSVSPVKLPAS